MTAAPSRVDHNGHPTALLPLSSLRWRYAADERALILEHLRASQGSTRRAAETLGEHHTQVCRLIERHGLRPELDEIRAKKKATRGA